jgi:c-di-GMP-binding flagellar brake protein YcgR
MKKFIERRRYPRIKKILPLKVSTDEYDISTETHNLSCIGAYCTVDRYIPPMTKLSILLFLPKDKKDYTKISCKGVVVRTEKQSLKKYNIAIFFNEISESQKNKILKYTEKYLPKD